ncbi:MAG: baseplate J/gp47 family protein, partial [Gammaproteobacteria bacterium]
RVKERGPRRLRHRYRSVTAQDLEDLAQEADADVARVRAVVPGFEPINLWLDPAKRTPAAGALGAHAQVAAGRMGVIVVPGSTAARPAPSLSMLRRVKAYLLARCPGTAELWVAGPEWVKVTVEATVAPVSLAQADAVTGNVVRTLNRFLHPLSGGPGRRGWAFDRTPLRSDIYAVIEAVDGVDHIRALKLTNDAHAGDPELKLKLDQRLNQSMAKTLAETPPPAMRQWLERSLVYSGRHIIRATLQST